MTLKYEELIAHVNDIAQLIDEVIETAEADIYGKCISTAKITHAELTKRGIPCQLVGGRAAFSFNKGRFGIIDYGYDQKAAISGHKIGHFWIESGEYIIDTTLRHLKSEAHKDDMMRGLPPAEFKLSTKMVLRKREVSTYRQLYRGKLGWHYLEIPGRGDQVWKGQPDRLEPAKDFM